LLKRPGKTGGLGYGSVLELNTSERLIGLLWAAFLARQSADNYLV